jgi:amino acid adenylation domain-containing protein
MDLVSQLAALDPQQRAALEQRVRALRAGPAASPAVTAAPPAAAPPAAAPGSAPLTPAQQGMWFLEQLGDDLPAYNIVAAWRVEGRVDVAALRRAWSAVVRRHGVLRTTFREVDEVPVQVLSAGGPALLQVEDLTGTPARDRDGAIHRYAQREVRHRFDLAAGPLARLRLLRLGEDEHRLLLAAHHIVLDGWSLSIVISDLLDAYAAGVAGREPGWAPLPHTFADYATAVAGADHRAGLEYWSAALEGMPQALDLPTDRPRPARPTFRGRRETFWIDADLTGRLRELARRHGGTLFTVLLAGWQALMSRYTNGSDIPVGTPISVRPDSGYDGVAGLFLNTVVIRADLAGDPGFAELVRRVSARAFDAYEHRDTPFERLVDRIATARDLSRNPLFQVLLVLQNTPPAAVGAAGIRLTPADVTGQIAKFDLSLAVTEQAGDGLRCDLDWAADLFDPDRIGRMGGHLRRLLAETVTRPDAPISELPLLTVAEQALLRAWNRTGQPVPPDSLPAQFAATAAAHPHRPALGAGGAWLSYAEVGTRVNQLARRLRRCGVDAETIVGVCLPRGVDLVVSLHAVQAAGGAYLPLEPEYPVERLRFMVRDAGATVVVTDRANAHLFDGCGAAVVCLDAERELISTLAATPPPSRAGLDNLAYVIYTSGSTGKPKGVGIPQRAIVNRLAWMQRYFPLGAGDRVLQKTPMSFDVSVWEFFWPLCVGAGLVVADPGGHRDSGYLVDVIERERVTTVHFVPSMLDAFCDEPGLTERLAHLRQVFASGEALPADLVTRCLRLLPGAALHNLYGPTEVAVDVTWQPCRGLDPSAGVPIGRAVPNTTLEILDPAGHRAPIGVPGELHLGGVQLGRGYLSRPGLTAERFAPDPYGAPGGRLYRTGDLARWRADGAVEYLGRLDHQVKIHGFRIELGEIEAALTDQPEIRAAAVLARGDGPAARLVAYLVTGAEVDWAARLRPRLPAHMVPEHYVVLDRLPVTGNGKLDRAALPDPARRPAVPVPAQRAGGPCGGGPAGAGGPPRAGTEASVATVWRAVLGVDEVAAGDDFFALGGDSIRSLKVAARLRARGWAVTVAELFTFRTVRELAAHLDRQRRQAGAASPPRPTDAFELLSAADRERLGQRYGDE